MFSFTVYNVGAFEIDSIFCDDEDHDQLAQECGVL